MWTFGGLFYRLQSLVNGLQQLTAKPLLGYFLVPFTGVGAVRDKDEGDTIGGVGPCPSARVATVSEQRDRCPFKYIGFVAIFSIGLVETQTAIALFPPGVVDFGEQFHGAGFE